MKKMSWVLGFLSISLIVGFSPFNDVSAGQCTMIKDGLLLYSPGHYLQFQPLKVGFDIFGYNYQAHIFNSYYVNAYIGSEGFPPYDGDDDLYLAQLDVTQRANVQKHWAWPYRKDVVMMKWNDAWLANSDCDSDGKLDRYFGFPAYIGSGAWETNHQSGTYMGDDGKEYRWNYFCKIIAVPTTAVMDSGVWYAADGKEIGPSIWGAFAITEEVYNDQGSGDHGKLYKSPARAGLGNWDY